MMPEWLWNCYTEGILGVAYLLRDLEGKLMVGTLKSLQVIP